jgi:protein TonB
MTLLELVGGMQQSGVQIAELRLSAMQTVAPTYSEESVSSGRWKFASKTILSLICITLLLGVVCPKGALAQEELTRKVKSKVAPVYPDLARRMSISGTVKLVVVVAPSGTVKETKVLGGHPVLVGAATDAVKKWKFEAAPEESTGTIEFTFSPSD